MKPPEALGVINSFLDIGDAFGHTTTGREIKGNGGMYLDADGCAELSEAFAVLADDLARADARTRLQAAGQPTLQELVLRLEPISMGGTLVDWWACPVCNATLDGGASDDGLELPMASLPHTDGCAWVLAAASADP